MWDIVQEHKPELLKTMAAVVKDQQLSRPYVMMAGFKFGCAFAIAEMMKGNIREVKGE
jgi:hypothetical protein